MPNPLAFVMLMIWPIVALILFRRLPPAQAMVWTILAGYLILPPPPAAFDFPLLPPLNKETIPSLAALAMVMVTGKNKGGENRRALRLIPQSRLARGLLLIFVLSPFPTYFTNTAPVFFGSAGLPGMRFFEAIALMVQQAMLAIPFLLGYALLTDHGARKNLFMALFVGGLVYSLPMLIEIRLSPQLNNWIYGYFQHYFAQSIRFGGFRPLVFLSHGLWASFFAMMAFVAALALTRANQTKNSTLTLLLSGYLGAILVLTKSLGAILYGMIFIPLLLLINAKWQIRLAGLLAALTIAYPMMKSADLIPVDYMLEQAAAIDPERSNSLKFRFDNEDILLERAEIKPIFGWGSWGRNHILDPVSGNITTVTDGRWIITLGVFGWVGFIAEFLLLALPIFALWQQAGRPGAHIPPLAGPLALLLAVNLVDLIPNATLTPLTWLIAGVILACAEEMRRTYTPPVPVPVGFKTAL